MKDSTIEALKGEISPVINQIRESLQIIEDIIVAGEIGFKEDEIIEISRTVGNPKIRDLIQNWIRNNHLREQQLLNGIYKFE